MAVREAHSDTPVVGIGRLPPASTKPAEPLQRLVPRPLTDRARSWAVTLSLTLIAGLVRLWNLGYPTDRGTPVFDEKHYAPQAWQMLRIADGVSEVQSRIGMLDIFLATFILAAFGCLIIDREQVHKRLATVVRENRVADTDFGPRLGVRWWRFSAGVLLGLACGTKWSAVYYLVAFAGLSLVWDACGRRIAGVRRPWAGTLLRDLTPASWALAVVPVGAYLATWWAWFSSETGVDRHAVGNQIGAGGPMSFVPGALRSLWYYSAAVLRFHENLVTPAHPHPWESKPWSWPMGLRPMLYYYESGAGTPGCGRQDCVASVMLVGTPAMWWLTVPVLAWALWRE